MPSRAAHTNRTHHPDADRTEDRASSIIHMSSTSKVRWVKPARPPVTGQLAQLNEARQCEATQRRGAPDPNPQAARSKEAQGDEHGDVEEERCAYTVVAKRRTTHAGSQIPLAASSSPLEARVAQFGVRDAIRATNRGQRQRKNRSKQRKDAVTRY